MVTYVYPKIQFTYVGTKFKKLLVSNSKYPFYSLMVLYWHPVHPREQSRTITLDHYNDNYINISTSFPHLRCQQYLKQNVTEQSERHHHDSTGHICQYLEMTTSY
jgi:NAD-dependent oxidoreductase involved in siderophore biosynthesis